jgi:hypothetical protein
LSKQPVETTLYSLSACPPQRPDRRSGNRYVSLLRVGVLLVDDRRELCLIRNISAGGMMIRPYSPLVAGTRLSIELKQGECVNGIAQWIEDGLVGITFDTAIDVVAMLAASSGQPRPRMPRIELDCTASVREDADVYRTTIANISQGGICVRINGELRINANVIVSIPGLPPTAGVVKWRDEDSYGIGFNRVFPVDELMNFLRAQQQAEPLRATA